MRRPMHPAADACGAPSSATKAGGPGLHKAALRATPGECKAFWIGPQHPSAPFGSAPFHQICELGLFEVRLQAMRASFDPRSHFQRCVVCIAAYLAGSQISPALAATLVPSVSPFSAKSSDQFSSSAGVLPASPGFVILQSWSNGLLASLFYHQSHPRSG